MLNRTLRELSTDDIERVASTYRAWQRQEGSGDYADIPGFCKSATLEEVRKHDHVLTPGRYVGAPPRGEASEPFADEMTRLAAEWRQQQAEAERLDAEIEANLRTLGFPPPE